jgi:hypothetical protein
MARYELLVDGQRRWRVATENGVRRWISDYRQEHADDDPDAAHVQVRRIGALSWLTGGTIVDRTQFLD